MDTLIKKEIATNILGYCGRVIAGSKGQYRYDNPTNITVFNSNLCTLDDGKIWYGDLDITLDEPKLIEIAKKIGCLIYVLYEMDARFENEKRPKTENAILIIAPNGTTTIGVKHEKYYHRNDQGILVSYTDKELKKLHPEDYKKTKKDLNYWKKEDFRKKEIKTPISKIKLPKRLETENLLITIHEFLEKSSGIKTEKMDRLYLTKKQNKEITNIIKKFLRNKGLRGYSLQREINWLPLCVNWNTFYCSTPKWADETCFYVKKEKKKEKETKEKANENSNDI